jgi:hypothetical protein
MKRIEDGSILALLAFQRLNHTLATAADLLNRLLHGPRDLRVFFAV